MFNYIGFGFGANMAGQATRTGNSRTHASVVDLGLRDRLFSPVSHDPIHHAMLRVTEEIGLLERGNKMFFKPQSGNNEQ